MTASVLYPVFAIGGWGQGATMPVSASEVAISAAGAVIAPPTAAAAATEPPHLQLGGFKHIPQAYVSVRRWS
jgi:hypothetical protein